MTRPQAVEPFSKQAPPELRLAEALRDLIGGVVAELPSPAPILSEVRPLPAVEPLRESRMYVQLTDREEEVLALMAQGLDTAEIGARMYLAVRTVKSYVAMVLAKLNAANRAHAVAIAFRMGFIAPTLDELLGMDTTDKEGETRPVKIKPVQQTCATPGCRDVAGFVVAVAAGGDGGIRAARRCCGEHLEETVFWAEGVVASDARARYALINRWGPWALQLDAVPG